MVIVPTWNIETWLAYLAGKSVDETKGDYPRLPRESDCQSQVEALAAMCEQGQLRPPAPASLQDACGEYERFPLHATLISELLALSAWNP